MKVFTVYPDSVYAAETAGTCATADTFANTCSQHTTISCHRACLAGAYHKALRHVHCMMPVYMCQQEKQTKSAEIRDFARSFSHKLSALLGSRLTAGGGGGEGGGPSSGSGDTGLGEGDGEPASGEGEAGLADMGEASGVPDGLLSPVKPSNKGNTIWGHNFHS